MRIFYGIVQCTWGIVQTLLGFCVFVLHFHDRHYRYHGAVVTEWRNSSSVSLGMFVFITNDPFFAEKVKNQISRSELSKRLLVHEYGHTIQSLLLGPFYLIIIGIPSTVWGFSPSLAKKRHNEQTSYFSFYTEKWANRLGEKATEQKAMEQLVIE